MNQVKLRGSPRYWKKKCFPSTKGLPHTHTRVTLDQMGGNTQNKRRGWGIYWGEIIEDKNELILQYCHLLNFGTWGSNVHVLFRVMWTFLLRFDRVTYDLTYTPRHGMYFLTHSTPHHLNIWDTNKDHSQAIVRST